MSKTIAGMGLAFALTACSSLTPLHPAPDYTVPNNDEPNQRSASLLGYCVKLHEEGDLNLAAAICNRAHEFNPTDPAPLVELASILNKQDRDGAAAEAYRAALLLEPQNVDALYGLGKIYIDQQHYDLAMEPLQAAALLETKDPRVYNAMGVIMDQQGEHTAAQSYYEQGLAHEPRNISLRNNLGLSLVLSGQEAEGMAMLREVATEPEATATASRNLEMAAQIAIENREAAANNVAEIDAKAQTEEVTPAAPALQRVTAAPTAQPVTTAPPTPQTATQPSDLQRRTPPIAIRPAPSPIKAAAETEPRELPRRAPSVAARSAASQTAAAQPASRTAPQTAPETEASPAINVAPASSMDQEIAAAYATPETTASERPSFSRSAWRESMDAIMPETASKPAKTTAPRLTQSTPPRLAGDDAGGDLPISLAAAPVEAETKTDEPTATDPATAGATQTSALKIVKAPQSNPESSPTKTSAAASGTAQADGDSIYTVQLGSYSDTKSAQRGWNILQDSSEGLLADLDGMIVMADLGGEKGTVYRVRTAPLAGSSAANELCEQLRTKGLDCMPVKTSQQETDGSLIQRVCHAGSEAGECGKAAAATATPRAAQQPAEADAETPNEG